MNKVLAMVHEIALEVRSWCEKEADKSSRESTLMGFCAIGSAELYRRLKKQGVEAEIHMYCGEECSHVYLLVDDHVVDITATQFDEFRYEPVLIVHSKVAEQHYFYQSFETFRDVKALRKYQNDNKWPRNQVAYTA
jgi:hypothetical protein